MRRIGRERAIAATPQGAGVRCRLAAAWTGNQLPKTSLSSVARPDRWGSPVTFCSGPAPPPARLSSDALGGLLTAAANSCRIRAAGICNRNRRFTGAAQEERRRRLCPERPRRSAPDLADSVTPPALDRPGLDLIDLRGRAAAGASGCAGTIPPGGIPAAISPAPPAGPAPRPEQGAAATAHHD
jgi:hypothetical protein